MINLSASATEGSDTAAVFSPPEPGQLVEVRRRQWVVADMQTSAAEDGHSSPQHFVTLSSIDEDSLGEQIEVVWEIEPGAHVIEKAGLPSISGQDDTERLEAFLDAVRWGAATNADRGFLQAPFRSGVSIEDFQLDPLVRAIDMARANLLIADDVGLGKTIEAGLVIQELLLRHRARSVFIVCPASLQEKWRVEMLEKFGLEFKIVNTEYVKDLRRSRGIHANPWMSFPRLITSVDWIKSGEPLRMLRDILPIRAQLPQEIRHTRRRRSSQCRSCRIDPLCAGKSADTIHTEDRAALSASAFPDRHAAQRLHGVVHVVTGVARRPEVLTKHPAGRQATLAGHDQALEKRPCRQRR